MGEAADTWRANALEWLGAALVLAWSCGAIPARADDDPPARVGRVSDFGGELYLATQDRPADWAKIGVNYPVTIGDNLWVSPNGRAEIDFGSGQLRLAGDTNLQVSMLDEHRLALFVASGRVIVRLRTLEQRVVGKLRDLWQRRRLSPWAGRPIASVTGPGLVPGAGRGSMTRRGDTLRLTMGGGYGWRGAGAGVPEASCGGRYGPPRSSAGMAVRDGRSRRALAFRYTVGCR
jgi:hypothetical protein